MNAHADIKTRGCRVFLPRQPQSVIILPNPSPKTGQHISGTTFNLTAEHWSIYSVLQYIYIQKYTVYESKSLNFPVQLTFPVEYKVNIVVDISRCSPLNSSASFSSYVLYGCTYSPRICSISPCHSHHRESLLSKHFTERYTSKNYFFTLSICFSLGFQPLGIVNVCLETFFFNLFKQRSHIFFLQGISRISLRV